MVQISVTKRQGQNAAWPDAVSYKTALVAILVKRLDLLAAKKGKIAVGIHQVADRRSETADRLSRSGAISDCKMQNANCLPPSSFVLRPFSLRRPILVAF